jgi:transposase-like protein
LLLKVGSLRVRVRYWMQLRHYAKRHLRRSPIKRKRHTPEQIIRKLRTAEQLLHQGQSVADVCWTLEVSAPTNHRRQQLYGGMKATEAKRLKELEQENTRRKQLLADTDLDKEML